MLSNRKTPYYLIKFTPNYFESIDNTIFVFFLKEYHNIFNSLNQN